eukprot:TRINITY_DN4222_c0_g1_i9.p1 TRINITY_DN4222_c0_g1~~TRINITY_DN4222_c0_g1_i9.p1  ORF type:complete len:119 (-),score=13.46 TRINITY_DN4222_c0_g1_i9:23-379(-)
MPGIAPQTEWLKVEFSKKKKSPKHPRRFNLREQSKERTSRVAPSQAQSFPRWKPSNAKHTELPGSRSSSRARSGSDTSASSESSNQSETNNNGSDWKREIGRAVQQECRDRSRMPSSA